MKHRNLKWMGVAVALVFAFAANAQQGGGSDSKCKAFKSSLAKDQQDVEFKMDTFHVNHVENEQMDKDFSNAGMISAIENSKASYQKLLDKYYNRLMGKLKSQEDKDKLAAAQKAWKEFAAKDLDAYSQIEYVEGPNAGGSLVAVDACSYSSNLVLDRLVYIYHLLQRVDDGTKKAAAADCAKEIAQNEEYHKNQDAELNKYYKLLMNSKLKEQESKDKLRFAQRAWLTFRTKELEFSKVLSEKYSTGDARRVLVHEWYRSEVLHNRVSDLRSLLNETLEADFE